MLSVATGAYDDFRPPSKRIPNNPRKYRSLGPELGREHAVSCSQREIEHFNFAGLIRSRLCLFRNKLQRFCRHRHQGRCSRPIRSRGQSTYEYWKAHGLEPSPAKKNGYTYWLSVGCPQSRLPSSSFALNSPILHNGSVNIRNGDTMEITGIENVTIPVARENSIQCVTLKNVLLIPTLTCKLLSLNAVGVPTMAP